MNERKSEIGAWGIDLTGTDKKVNPGDDFFRYAVGSWTDRATIPADLPEWNSAIELALKAESDVRKVIERLTSKQQAPGSIEQKVADAYSAYLDTKKINELGLKPFEADLAAIHGLNTHEEIAALVGRPGMPVSAPIAFDPDADFKNPDRYALYIVQSGLGLGMRDFYLGNEPAFVKIREKYREYIERMLTLANIPDAKKSASTIADLETRIAQLHWPREKQRNLDLTYNLMSRADLKKFAPGFPWESLLVSSGVSDYDHFVVKEKDAIAGLAQLFRATPVATWRLYLTFHYLNGQSDIMPTAFDQANFELYGKVLSGQPQQRERWRRAIGFLDGAHGDAPLAEAVGQMYVKENFPPETKAAVRRLVDNLLKAYQKRIETLKWMSPETRAAAIRKAQTVRIKIGFPDRWRDYSGVTIQPEDAYGNRKRLSIFESNRQLSRLNQKTDKDEWGMAPQTVNAYYRASFNEIVFPAAILKPPYFDPNADPAVNYGAVGGVIGHEMGHGYDDQGAKSDENGVLRSWWKPEDEERFRNLTKALAAQYSSYSPVEGFHLNGSATSGENIGDLGGLSVALQAYETSLEGKPAPVLDGFTGVQRFFLGWAQAWRGVYRDERLRQAITTDNHSPNMYRVNGVVRNIDAWYQAFDVKERDKLYFKPEERVRIW